MNLIKLQEEVAEWTAKNFDNRKPHHPLLGLVEEVGELSHAHLKAEQGIRTNEDHHTAKIDAVGDTVIYLADYCTTQGISLDGAVEKTWNEVRKRNWKENEEDGGENKSMRYQLQKRSDSHGICWVELEGELFESYAEAFDRAKDLCKRRQYPAIRLVDINNGYVLDGFVMDEKECACSVVEAYQWFYLQNRYQDSGWENLPRERFRCLETAKERAHELSGNPIAYGMVRVIDAITNKVVTTYPAG